MGWYCIQTAMGAVGAAGFAVLFNIRGSRLVWTALGGALSWAVYLVCTCHGQGVFTALLCATAAARAGKRGAGPRRARAGHSAAGAHADPADPRGRPLLHDELFWCGRSWTALPSMPGWCSPKRAPLRWESSARRRRPIWRPACPAAGQIERDKGPKRRRTRFCGLRRLCCGPLRAGSRQRAETAGAPPGNKIAAPAAVFCFLKTKARRPRYRKGCRGQRAENPYDFFTFSLPGPLPFAGIMPICLKKKKPNLCRGGDEQ